MNRNRLLIVVYIVGGSWVAIFQRFLTFSFDSWTLNAGRFLAGAAALLVLARIFRPSQLRDILHRPALMRNIVLLAALGIVPQALYVEGLARTSAIMSSLISLLGLPLSIALAVTIFPDERRSVRGPGFAAGAVLATGATIGLALGQGNLSLEYSTGVIFAFASTLVGVAMGLMLKRLAVAADPLCVSGLTTGLTAAVFVLAALVWGNPASILAAPALADAVLFGSGVYGLLIGGALYTTLIKRSGLVIARFADLAMPVFTGLFGFLLFGETLTPFQLACGGLLLLGCALILLKRGSAAQTVDMPPDA